MNHSNFQPMQQVSAEEVQRRTMTQEELHRTQVLNLQEVEKIARFEKRTSKKPAFIVGIMGILLITFGTTFQIAKTLSEKPEPVIEKRDISTDVLMEEEVKKETTLECSQSSFNNPDGTDTIYTITYRFDEDKLVGFTKVFNVVVTPGAVQGPATVQRYLQDYQPFLNPTEGYAISVIPINNGLTTTVDVDYEKLDLTLLAPKQQEHFSTKIDFPLDTSYDFIHEAMINYQFICQ